MSEQWRQLTYFPPEKIKEELFPERQLHEEVSRTRQFFREQKQRGKVDITDPFITAQVLVWQYVDYQLDRPDSYHDSARGYLMVEPADIPLATCILDSVYQERKEKGSLGQFKWLMRKLPNTELSVKEWWHEVHKDEKVGLYEELSETDPRIVLYESSPSEIQEVLAALAASPDWQALESSRTEAFSDRTPPIRGTNRFTDSHGKMWHSLTYNANVGHSHKQ